MTELDKNRLPRHVAIIMDGNGRWAQSKGMPRLEGHRVGVESVRDIVKAARDIGLGYITLYTFSEENWQRPRLEVEGLMQLLDRYLRKEIEELHQNDVRLQAIGNLQRLPKVTRKTLQRAMVQTAENKSLTLSLALSYGGRQELAGVCRFLAAECAAGRMNPDDIDEAVINSRLSTRDLPDPDLLIRTGGEMRLSNFLLWQTAYTEIYVTDTYWPDFRREALVEALLEYQRRQRRFGKTAEQIAAESGKA